MSIFSATVNQFFFYLSVNIDFLPLGIIFFLNKRNYFIKQTKYLIHTSVCTDIQDTQFNYKNYNSFFFCDRKWRKWTIDNDFLFENNLPHLTHISQLEWNKTHKIVEIYVLKRYPDRFNRSTFTHASNICTYKIFQ